MAVQGHAMFHNNVNSIYPPDSAWDLGRWFTDSSSEDGYPKIWILDFNKDGGHVDDDYYGRL